MKLPQLFLLAATAFGDDPDDGCRWGTKTPPACPHPSQPVPRGPYAIARDRIAAIPGVKNAANADERAAIITYPMGSSDETFPLIVFGHGAMVSGQALIGDGYHTLFNTVASYGFIVVAPLGCKMCDFTHDMLATADACRDSKLHPALAQADLSRTGFFGHSNGGCATQELAGNKANIGKYNIKAAVSMHCGCPSQTGPCKNYGSKGSNVPFMYTTASGDSIAPPAGSTNGYNLAGDGSKIVFMPQGGTHFEPADSYVPRQATGAGGANREDQPVGLFFACHVRGEHCDEVYGPSGDAICRNNGSKMNTCKVQKGGPTPPPPAPTPGPTPVPTPPVPTPPVPTPVPAPSPAPTPSGFTCDQCKAQGYAEDVCNCGVCGSFGLCTFTCKPGGRRVACKTDSAITV